MKTISAGVATIQFLRYVPPKAVGATLDQPTTPSTVVVARPRPDYPEMVFAGAASDSDLDNFHAEVQAVVGTPPIPSSEYPSVSVPDPDVVTLEVIVEAQAPKHDTGNPASMKDMNDPPLKADLDGNFRVLYTQRLPFTGDSMVLTIDPQAIPDTVLWTPPGPPSTTLVVPTGRNLRIRLRGLGDGDLSYWGKCDRQHWSVDRSPDPLRRSFRKPGDCLRRIRPRKVAAATAGLLSA